MAALPPWRQQLLEQFRGLGLEEPAANAVLDAVAGLVEAAEARRDDARDPLPGARQLIAAAPLPVLVVDRLAFVRHANRRAAAVLGFADPGQLEGHTLARLFSGTSPDLSLTELMVREPRRRLITAVTRSESPERVDLYFASLGAPFMEGDRVLFVLDPAGVPPDASTRRFGFAGLRHAVARLAVFASTGQCLFANEAFARALGRPAGDLPGKYRNAFGSDLAAQRGDGQSATALARDQVVWSRERWYGSDEGPACDVCRFAIDEPRGVVELWLAESGPLVPQSWDRSLRQLLELGEEGFFVADGTGRLIWCSSAFTRITGLVTDGERAGVELLLSDRTSQAVLQDFWRQLHRHGRWSDGPALRPSRSAEPWYGPVVIERVNGEGPGEAMLVGVIADHRQRQLYQEQLRSRASSDALTGLGNSAYFEARMREQLIAGGDQRMERAAVGAIDLDHFRNVNDSLGHAAGDLVLRRVAGELAKLLPDDATLARIGGDEFVFMLPGIGREAAAAVCDALLARFAEPFALDHGHVNLAASIGLALYPDHGRDGQGLMRCAEQAMNDAKTRGRRSWRSYEPTQRPQRIRTRLIESALDDAIAAGEFSTVFQPQVHAATGEVFGCEALLRWTSPTLGHVEPSEFIPVAEAAGQIVAIGDLMLERTLKEFGAFVGCDGLELSLNLSPQQIALPGLAERLSGLCAMAEVAPARVTLEITETIFLRDPDATLLVLEELDAAGFAISMDDFGTGFSSMKYLTWMPLTEIKIDAYFVRCDDDSRRQEVCRLMLDLGDRLGLRTVAEGVETPGQYARIREMGCGLIQGYLFAKPMSGEALLRWLETPAQVRLAQALATS